MTHHATVVVGAGIAGLTTALALAHEGLPATVLERAGAPRDAGGGIQLPPNAVRVLQQLGLGRALAEHAVRPVGVEVRRWSDGRLLSWTRLGATASFRYDAAYYTLTRATLHRLLRAAVTEACGAGTVRYGRGCERLAESAAGVTLRLSDGTYLNAGTVIGADGLHSVVRRRFADDALRYSGYQVHRTVLPGGSGGSGGFRPGPARVVVWLGPDRHCVSYPVDRDHSMNVVAVVRGPYAAAGPDDLPGAFRGWHRDVLRLLEAAAGAGPQTWGLYDRPPLARWHSARVAVIGDAAHPMLPFLAQGAALAVEDAATIAGVLGRGGDLASYEATRRHRVFRVVGAVEAARTTHHLADGARQRERDLRLAAEPAAARDWLFDHRIPAGATR
jgi:salicylate hydroxylase